MAIHIISDLHLDNNQPVIAELFLRYLKNDAKNAQALYILGDFFEAWVGDDNLTEFNVKIMQALREATQAGLPIYVMHGNRDFLLGKRFFKATGCKLLSDEYVVDLYGVPTLLMHGDTLCTADINYLKFRKKVRRWWVQKLFLMKSLASRQAIANQYRDASKNHTSTLPDYIMDVTQAEVERVMLKHKVQHMIHGHTHRKAVHTFSLSGKTASRTVLGAWHDSGNVLICKSKGKICFMDITSTPTD